MKTRFFDLAKNISLKSSHHQHKMGCVIVRKNKVVSLGFNEIKTHTRSIHKYNMLHAEISAIIGCSFEDLRGSEAYIFRQRKDGGLAMARPCEACRLALARAGIAKVYYTSESGYQEEDV